jgi:hypothetical protein
MARLPNWLVPAGLALAALAFYVLTLAPTVLWGDDAYFQRTAFDGALQADGGGHWLWLQVARLFLALPFGDFAFRANLLSAVAAALTVLGLFVLGRSLGLSRSAALAAAAGLAVAHTFWMHAVRAEVYSTFTALLVLELGLLCAWSPSRAWPLWLAAALFGLALLGHQMALLLLPAAVYLVLARRAWLTTRAGLFLLAAFVAGLVPALAVIQAQVGAPSLPGSLIAYFTRSGVDYTAALLDFSLARLPRDAALWLGFLGLQFASPAFVLLLAGGWAARRILDQRWHALGVLYLASAVFAFSYRVNDQYAFYLPSYVAAAPFIGLGWQTLAERWPVLRPAPRRWALAASLLLIPPLVYASLALGLRQLDRNPLGVRQLPGREPNTYFIWPGKAGYFGARDYGAQALGVLPPGALLLADYTPLETLRYLQTVERLRPDVQLVKVERDTDLAPFLAALAPGRQAFLADDNPRYYNLASLPGSTLLPHGVVFHIVTPTAPPPRTP